jgi:L-threonylcarbamoyladenylate synthase
VVFPTETVYGLGANALDESAVKKIYAAKGRPPDNPLIVHVAKREDIYKYTEVPDIAGQIIKKFMPAPLTLVLRKKDKTLNASSAGLDTVAIRTPKNNTAGKLIELAGVPVAAPSANLSGKPSPTNAGHVISDLDGRVDMIIQGENCEIGLESTVLSFNPDNSVNILRSGFITREMLSEFKICDNMRGCFGNHGAPPAPGMKYTHYAPDAPLYILSGSDEAVKAFVESEAKNKKTGFLCREKIKAKNLFRELNEFNLMDLDVIYSAEPDKAGIGEAVYDRLIKAAGGKVIKL